MRITGQDILNTISKTQSDNVFDSGKPASSTGRASQTQSAPSDGIELGSQNGLLGQAQSTGADTGQARVDQLRALILSGQYQVDTKALSQSIVAGTLNGD